MTARELDGANNWASTTTELAGTVTQSSRGYGALNELNYDSASAISYGYDAVGNRVFDNEFDYTWDGVDRLRTVKDASQLVASYTYDALGRLEEVEQGIQDQGPIAIQP